MKWGEKKNKRRERKIAQGEYFHLKVLLFFLRMVKWPTYKKTWINLTTWTTTEGYNLEIEDTFILT